MSEEVISGIIEGEEKDLDVLNEYMLSTVSLIKEELLMEYPQEISEFYVYNKYNEKDVGAILICLSSLVRTSNFLVSKDKLPVSPRL